GAAGSAAAGGLGRGWRPVWRPSKPARSSRPRPTTARCSGTAAKRTSAAPCCRSARPATACTRARGPALGYARRMNRLLLLSLSLAGIVAVLSPSAAKAQRHADTILVGGKVWTGNPAQPEAQALAIVDRSEERRVGEGGR